MKLRSFRLRIALLSAALAGSALVGFSFVAWRLIYVAKVSRLDAKLEHLTKRATRPRTPDWWQPFTASLPKDFATTFDTPIVLLSVGADGQTLFQSGAETADIDLRGLLPPVLPQSLLPAGSPQVQTVPDGGDRPTLQLDPTPDVVLGDTRIFTQHSPAGSWRVGVVSSTYARAGIAVSLEAIHQEMGVIRNIFVVVISGTLLLVAGGAWGLSGNALRPIQSLTAAIQQVNVTGFHHHVPIETTDGEFIELIQVFNQMLERLERSFKQASRFSGDAAHELKTPLAILQGELEQVLQQAEPGSALQQSLSTLLDEVRRLSGIVRKLLLLSLADAGQMSLHTTEVAISDMLTVFIEDVELLAPHLEVQTQIEEGLQVWGDRDLLAQVLQNLISNAIKYNLPDGWIRVEAIEQQHRVQVTVINASNDIPAEERDRLFDRFYRGDPARTRKVEGVGLGLSLSREIVRAHQGNLTLDATVRGQTALSLSLPKTS